MLAPFINEVELLFFQSALPDNLPGTNEIRQLAELAAAHEITYNIHLPLDISLTARRSEDRRNAIATLKSIFELAAPLAPTTWTLHLPEEDIGHNFDGWYERAWDSISRICPEHIPGPALSVETLSYPPEWIDSLISGFDLSICLDIGHMAVYGYDWRGFFEDHAARIPIIHLYGFGRVHEHLGLDCLTPDRRRKIAALLKVFSGTVCLEVFSKPHLEASLKVLSEMA